MAKKQSGWQADPKQIARVVSGQHDDPFAILGLHESEGQWIARALVPHAQWAEVRTLDGKPLGKLEKRDDAGFFEGPVTIDRFQPVLYHAGNDGGEWDVIDPYSFGPVLGPMDDYYIGEGSHLRLFDKMGAHFMTFEGVEGTHFAVWAPNARRVSVVGSFNDWDGRRHAMRLRNQAYMEARKSRDYRHEPMSVYEVHLGSWRKRPDGGFLSYEQLAEQLVPYAADMGFTHIELLPISEHPYDPSWGYQPTGLYAPTARFGDPAGFARFVDAAHNAGLGIILDWVPAHFPTDEHGLAKFDGTALYEHADPRQGYHPDWNTVI